MTIDLSEKTAFITGASQGIGAAAARHLADLGANVVMAARSAAAINSLAGEIGTQALAVPCDVSEYDQVQEAVSAGVKTFGSLDIVVNNAGTIEPIARIEESRPDLWNQVIDINLRGVYHCMHAAFPHLSRPGGTIINISSGAATSALEGWSHYCASKAAVLSLTRCAHKEWSDLGIRVVGLSPGTVATEMQSAIRTSGVNPVSQLDWSLHIPPEWPARAIAWLTTDAARQFDGGDFSIKTEEGRRLVGLVAD
ncbi:MAG: SDR family oxidoreductase [Pseudomonadota bacterium]